MASADSDAEWILRSWEEPEAFTAVFERNYEQVYRFVARILGPDAAEDVAQRVFIRAFEKRKSYRPKWPDARPWLLAIAANEAKQLLRSESRRRRAERRFSSVPSLGSDVFSDSESRVDAAASKIEIRRALFSIPKRDRETLVLIALGNLTYREAAEVLAIPIGTVKSRINRARLNLQQILQRGEESIRGEDLGHDRGTGDHRG